MSRRVLITGLGPVTGLGLDLQSNWQALTEGRSAIAPITRFAPDKFDCAIAAEVPEFKIGQYVPKTYRKATKVMARDIQFAVVAADAAARDAGLNTQGTVDPKSPEPPSPDYAPGRIGAHIGAGLIAADLDELAAAFDRAKDDAGNFDIHRYGKDGINQLTPLWLLKYLPNMLACHVTIIHDAQGPSNTITCAETSGALSVGESMRVIQRNAADLCFCGGLESKLNPMGYLRQQYTGRLNANESDNKKPTNAIRPFCSSANGTAVGEGGAILTLESEETFATRGAHRKHKTAYAELLGFGASQSVHPEQRNAVPEPGGLGITLAIRAAMKEAHISPDQIDLIIPFGIGHHPSDSAEAQGLLHALGPRVNDVPICSNKPMVGNCAAGAAAFDIAIAAQALATQTVPATLNTETPFPGVASAIATESRKAELRHALVLATGSGGQNAALILKRVI